MVDRACPRNKVDSREKVGFDISRFGLPIECLVSKEFVAEHGAGIGDEVMMIGRFINREGIQYNSPTARFGHIAQMAGDPIDAQEEAILCEVRSIGGYSGSPVFVVPNRSYGRPGKRLPEDRVIILGVDFCHINDFADARDEGGRRMPHIRVPVNTGMAGVVPAWKLYELLMCQELVDQRTAVDTREANRREAPDAVTDHLGEINEGPPATDTT